MPSPEWLQHARRLGITLFTILGEAIFLAVWTLISYGLGTLLFERFEPPGYERVVIDAVRLIFTLTLIATVSWWVVLDAVRSVVSTWLEFRQWYREQKEDK